MFSRERVNAIRIIVGVASVGFLLYSACNTGVEPEESYHNKILFTSSRSGEQQLYMMNPDGTDVRQVTGGPLWHYFGRWSPDARQIVSLTNENITTACVQMVIQNIDGTNRRLIGCGGLMDWSPDGKKIVFAFSPRAELGDRTRSIYVINADGTGLKQLTDSLGVRDDSPSWSPDGTTIAFSSNRDYPPAPLRSEIYLMNADGSNQRRLTFTDTLINDAPAWSPDGNVLAFASNGGIAVIHKDGTDFQRLTETYKQGVGGFFAPRWSPDGKQLVIRWFAGDGSALTNVFKVNNDGTGLQKIIDDPTVSSADWSR